MYKLKNYLIIMPFFLMAALIGWIGECIQNHDYSSLLIGVIMLVIAIIAFNIIRKFAITKL